MVFSEVYGSYFNVIAAVLREAAEKKLTRKKVTAIIAEKAFAESMISIPNALENGEWKFLKADLTTPIQAAPTMPLTILQKRWMKSLLLDSRIRLFSPDESGLEDVKPLYRPEWLVYYDRYEKGDSYEDESYIRHFQTILQAIQQKKWLEIYFCGRNGAEHGTQCFPDRLEYSSKDDRFRLIASDQAPWNCQTINLGRIISCRVMEECTDIPPEIPQMRTKTLEFELTDERNALERVLLHFSHLEKETRRMEDNRYHVKLRYEAGDETEILIRILSFGAMIRVISPNTLIEKIRERLQKQNALAVRGMENGK